LVYEDAAGILHFTFDGSPAEEQSGKKSNLYLSQGALIEVGGKLVLFDVDTESKRERLATALERVKQFASSRGYIVLRDGAGSQS
jgi:hypothetical protein